MASGTSCTRADVQPNALSESDATSDVGMTKSPLLILLQIPMESPWIQMCAIMWSGVALRWTARTLAGNTRGSAVSDATIAALTRARLEEFAIKELKVEDT